MRRVCSHILLSFLLIGALLASPCYGATPADTTNQVFSDTSGWKSLVNDGAAYLAAATAAIAGPGAIDNQLLLKHDPVLGMYPLFDLTSGTRARFGAGVFYRRQAFYSTVSILRHDSRKQVISGTVLLNGGEEYQPRRWQAAVNLIEYRDDDLWFYGVGSDPREDPRSLFRPDTDQQRANFYQKKQQATLCFGIATTPKQEWYITSYLSGKKIRDGDDVPMEEWISRVFQTERLQGFGHTWWQWYAELAWHYDSRGPRSPRCASWETELYAGYAKGVGNTSEQLLRSGCNLAASLPLPLAPVCVQPRLLVNQVHNLRPGYPMAFTDYPRHPTFRGIATRYLLRNDEIILLPSFDLVTSLHPNIRAGSFVDGLFAGQREELPRMTLRHAPWCVGMYSIVSFKNSDLGGVQAAYGSEGLRFMLWLGTLQDLNDRWRWK